MRLRGGRSTGLRKTQHVAVHGRNVEPGWGQRGIEQGGSVGLRSRAGCVGARVQRETV